MQKGVDVAIAVRALEGKKHYDRLLLFAGDGDMMEIIDHLVSAGKEVWVVGFSESMSESLVKRAGKVVYFDEYADVCRLDGRREDGRTHRFWAEILKAVPVTWKVE